MATTLTAKGSKNAHQFTLTVTENSTDKASNSSIITIAFQISGDFYMNWTSWGSNVSYTVTVNGQNYSGTIPSYGSGFTSNPLILINNTTQSVPHEADGTKTISMSFSVTDTTGVTYTCGNASSSGTMTLTAISLVTQTEIKMNNNYYWDAANITVRDGDLTLEQFFEPVLLWPATEDTARLTTLPQYSTLTLNESYKNFTFLYVEYTYSSTSTELWTTVQSVAALDSVSSNSNWRFKLTIIDNANTPTRSSRVLACTGNPLQLTTDEGTRGNSSNYNVTLPYRIYGIR